MVIPKSKKKQRRFFIELNYLQKVDFEKAKHLINKGDISSVVRGVEVLMRSPYAPERKGFTDITEVGTKITTPPDTTSKERISAYISTVEYSHNIPLGESSPTKP